MASHQNSLPYPIVASLLGFVSDRRLRLTPSTKLRLQNRDAIFSLRMTYSGFVLLLSLEARRRGRRPLLQPPQINSLSSQGLGGPWELAKAKARRMACADCLPVNERIDLDNFVREFLKGVWGKHNISLAKYYRSNGTLRCSSARSFPHVKRVLIQRSDTFPLSVPLFYPRAG